MNIHWIMDYIKLNKFSNLMRLNLTTDYNSSYRQVMNHYISTVNDVIYSKKEFFREDSSTENMINIQDLRLHRKQDCNDVGSYHFFSHPINKNNSYV